MKHIITILDFETGITTIMEYNSKPERAEIWLSNNGYNPNNCQWMITDAVKIKINLFSDEITI